MNQLTQEQLNASTVIRGLIDIQMINFDSRYSFGKITLEYIKNHLDGWDYHTRKEIKEKLLELSELLG